MGYTWWGNRRVTVTGGGGFLGKPVVRRLEAGGATDVFVHRAMRGIVPDRVLARRDKVAFQPPQDRWLRESQPAWLGLADNSSAERTGLLAPRTMRRALEGFEAGRIGSNVLWRVLNLEMWLRRSIA